MDLTYNQLEIIKSFVNSRNDKVCFIGINNTMMEKLPGILEGDFSIIDLKNDVSPFKPFLNILANLKPSEELIKKESFSIQEKTIISYLKNGVVDERYDLPIENEFDYEKIRFITTIVSLLEKLNTKKYLIINSQNIFSDSIDLIKKIEKSNMQGKFVFCYDGTKLDFPSSATMKFIEEFSNKSNFLYFNESSVTENTRRIKSKGNQLTFPIHFSFDRIIKALKNNRAFISVKQLKFLTTRITNNIKNLDLTEEQNRILSLEMALAYNTCGMLDESILFLSSVFDSRWDSEQKIIALFYLANVFFKKKSNDIAEKYLLQLYEILQKKSDSPYYALATMIDYQYTKRSDVEVAKQKYKNALNELANFGYLNNFISLGLSVPWQLINEIDSREFIDKTIEKCYRLSIEIDNQHLVSSACHWKGIMHSHYGESEEAMKWYNECNKIRTEIGEIGPLLNIRNGLSYESLCRALYENAYNLINEIIPCLYERNDYSCVIDTLKNIAYSLFYSRHFKEANDILKMNLHFLYTFNMENQLNNSFLPSTNDILLYKTIIDFDFGDVIHARINYSSIINDKSSITYEEKPLLFFIQASLFVIDKEIENAEKSIELCVDDFKKIKNVQTHKIVFVLYEFANILQKYDYNEKSSYYFNMGFEIAKKNNLSYYTKDKENIILKDYIDGVKLFEPLRINLSFLYEKAEKDELMIQLHKRILDYQFLNKIKTDNIQNMNLNRYLQDIILSIFEYTTSDSVFVCNAKDRSQLYSISRGKNVALNDEIWDELFNESSKDKQGQFIYVKKEKLYFGNLCQYDYQFGIIIIPNKTNQFSSDTMNTLNIALSSIQAQIVIYKQNENLLFISSTDQLSMLKNRHALSEYVITEGERIRRYYQKKKIKLQIAVAFIDLDNFKYYNDNFGHDTGDFLISCFSKLLSQTCRRIDFISRFGGDEFVIIMIDTSDTEAVRLYERLSKNLEKAQYFIPALNDNFKIKKFDIPQEYRLGFSMGVSTNFDTSDSFDLNKVIGFADKALYYSKENKKGSVTIWNTIKDRCK